MARLDRLGAAKEIAQIGAAIGREFSYELLAAVAPTPKTDLDRALDQLTDSGLAFRRGPPPEATYTFKHALVQDAAYDSLLKSRRQALHATIARVLAEDFPQTTVTEPELLAHHLTAAGQAAAAIPLLAAGGHAGPETSGAQGSDCAPEPGHGDPRHAAAVPGARRARTGPAHAARYSLDSAQRLGSA